MEPSEQFYKLPLICPISKRRMKFPARAECCSKVHFQCFDLYSFLEISAANDGKCSRWRCPICGIPLSILDIKHCKFTYELIQYVNLHYALVVESATFEQQKKEVEYAFFDTTIFGKLILSIDGSTSIKDLEGLELRGSEKKFANFGLVRIGGRYHLPDYTLTGNSMKFYEYSTTQPHIQNIRDQNHAHLVKIQPNLDLFLNHFKAIQSHTLDPSLSFKDLH